MIKFLRKVAALVAATFLLVFAIYLARTVIANWLERLLHDFYLLLIIVIIAAVVWLWGKLKSKAT